MCHPYVSHTMPGPQPSEGINEKFEESYDIENFFLYMCVCVCVWDDALIRRAVAALSVAISRYCERLLYISISALYVIELR